MNPYYERTGWLGALLSLVGVVVVGWVLIWQLTTAYIPGWVFAVGLVSVACWILLGERSIWRPPWSVAVAASVVMVMAGAIGASPSNGLLIVPTAIGVMRLVAEPRTPLWVGVVLALLAAALVALGSLTVTVSVLGLLALLGGILLGLLGGVNRRQVFIASVRESELAESTMAAREEHARVSTLESRQAVARDIHDVLAHSLGGVVMQLDAVEALLESGRVDEAETRVRDARVLAASGLGEARRAVEALRLPAEERGTVGAAELMRSLKELVTAHESMTAGAPGSETVHDAAVAFSSSGDARDVPAQVAIALRRALQESLSNARKHAPSTTATATVVWQADRVTLTVSNPLARVAARAGTSSASLVATGGANGLAGMKERFAALPGGSMEAGVSNDCFVVRAEAGLT